MNNFQSKNPQLLSTACCIKRETIERAVNKAEGNFYVLVGSANNLASSTITDALFYLKKHNFYNCREGRKWAVQADKKYKEYEIALKYHLKDYSSEYKSEDGRDKYNLWLDVTDKVYDDMQIHLIKLFQALKFSFDKYKIKEAEALAYIWTAHIVTDIACAIFDKLFKTIKDEFKIDISELFNRGRITDVYTCWDKATDVYGKLFDTHTNKVIDLYKEKNVVLAVDVITVQLSNMDLYNKAGDYGIGQNLDIVSDDIKQEYFENHAN